MSEQFPGQELVIFEDYHLLAFNKPAPLLTQARPEISSLEAIAKQYIKLKYDKPAGVYLGIPHRLDRPVSGVVLFARNTKAAQRVHAQFQQHTVQKTYWALVHGCPTVQSGTWTDYLLKIEDEARAEISTEETPKAKLAITHWKVIRQFDDNHTMLQLQPKTGRMHQLRVQAASRGLPIVGDFQYGSTSEFGPPAASDKDRLVALHAQKLELSHPFRQEPLVIVAPLPDYWPNVGKIDEN
ncbi:MAG: RluA family pseudouridine synthase [Zavarzinella sp.]